jgi:hypothetical protein
VTARHAHLTLTHVSCMPARYADSRFLDTMPAMESSQAR